MRRAVDVRRAGWPRALPFAAGAFALCLVVARLLPGRLETLSGSKLTVLPVALALVLAVSWLSAVHPFKAFVLAFALLAIVQVQPAPVDIVFALLIATTVATVRVQPRIPAFVGLPLAGLVLLTVFSMTNAVSIHRAISFESTTLYMLALAVWLSWAFVRRGWVQSAVRVYVGVAAASGVLGAIALYVPIPARHLFVYAGSRAEGFFKDPNVYSAFLVPAAVILLDEIATPRILKWRRATLAGLFIAVSIGVVLAYSRAAWLNYAVAVVVLLFVESNRRGGLRQALKRVALLVMCGLVGFLVLLQTGSLGFLVHRSHLQAYDAQRFSNQATSFDDMFRHVFGFGPGQTEILRPLATHSSYVRIAFEQGLPGLTMLVLVLGGTLLCALLLVRRTVEVNGVGTAALLGIWLGQLANSFFIDTLHWRHLWIIAALIWCSYALASERAPAPVRPMPGRA